MRVCYFGIYSPDYPRNKIIREGLEQNGIAVIQCNSRDRGLKKYWSLYRQHKNIKNDYDVMIVGFLGQGIMPLARILCRKKIILDAFISLYNTNVLDRQLYSPKSFRAKLDFFLDWLSCRLADLVLLDTESHIKYFTETFKLQEKKFKMVFVGASDKLFYPEVVTKENKDFLVHFHGYFVPFHGVEYIIEAAKILADQDISWQIVTRFNGKYDEIKKKVEAWGLKKVNFYPEVPFDQLKNYINKADVCLGVFGKTIKRNLVIPNKIFEALACNKPVLTAQSKACQEILEDRIACLYCQPADPGDLAKKILELKNNEPLKKSIAANGRQLYLKTFTPLVIGKDLVSSINNLLI